METPRVLIVDDNLSLCNALRKALSQEGYEVLATLSAEEALGFVMANVFHVIVVDLRLPGLTGIEFTRQIRDMGCQAPVILITAYASLQLTEQARLSGIRDVVPKSLYFLKDVKERVYDAWRSGLND